jgi:hypothetical protein
MENVLTRKAGPLKVWQWGAIGGGLGLGYLLLAKKGTSTEEPKEEPILGGLGSGISGVGGGGVESVPATPTTPTPVAPTGEVGAPGPAGEPGPEGQPGESPSPNTGAEIASLAAKIKSIEHHGAPQSPGPGWIQNKEPGNSRNGQYYKIVKGKNGKEEHVYKSGVKIVTKKAVSAAKKTANHAAHAVRQHVTVSKSRANQSKHTAAIHHTKPTPLKSRVAPKTSSSPVASAKLTVTHSAKPASHPIAKKPAKKKKK